MFEIRLKEYHVHEVILMTTRGDYTEHFYRKEDDHIYENMIFMGKKL